MCSSKYTMRFIKCMYIEPYDTLGCQNKLSDNAGTHLGITPQKTLQFFVNPLPPYCLHVYYLPLNRNIGGFRNAGYSYLLHFILRSIYALYFMYAEKCAEIFEDK